MPAIPNKLMPWLQASAAMTLILLFCFVTVGPMLGLPAADDDMKGTLKDIMLILVGFLFGSAVSSAKKDDQNAALTAQLLPPTPPAAPAAGPSRPLAGAIPTGTAGDPVAVVEVPSPTA